MKRLLVFAALVFLSLNINAAISQSGITNLKQLDSNGIIELISGNQLTGYISDGPFEGPVVQTFFKNGKRCSSIDTMCKSPTVPLSTSLINRSIDFI